MKNLRIACAALSKRIYIGKISKEGLNFTGTPADVTSDCIKAIIDKIGIGNTEVVTCNGKPAFEISIHAIDAIAKDGGGNV